MEAELVENSQQWEEFVAKQNPNSILQSWGWGDFYSELGKKVFRIGAVKDKALVGTGLFIKYSTRFGSFLYCPRGPLFADKDAFSAVLAQAKEIGKKEGCLFLRLDPIQEPMEENKSFFQKAGFSEAGNYIQPEADWILDISKPTEELISEMRETTRRYLRKEAREGFEIASSTSNEDAALFASLVHQTSSRKGFSGQGENYYQKIVEVLEKTDQIRLYKTTKEGQILSMAMVLFYSDTAYYVHGASVEHDTQPVAYSAHIQAINDAKERGMRFYNFGGVVKENNFRPGHPWYGITFFKMGFGGFRREYLKAQDLPLRPAYSLYSAAEKGRTQLRRVLKGHSVY